MPTLLRLQRGLEHVTADGRDAAGRFRRITLSRFACRSQRSGAMQSQPARRVGVGSKGQKEEPRRQRRHALHPQGWSLLEQIASHHPAAPQRIHSPRYRASTCPNPAYST